MGPYPASWRRKSAVVSAGCLARRRGSRSWTRGLARRILHRRLLAATRSALPAGTGAVDELLERLGDALGEDVEVGKRVPVAVEPEVQRTIVRGIADRQCMSPQQRRRRASLLHALPRGVHQ